MRIIKNQTKDSVNILNIVLHLTARKIYRQENNFMELGLKRRFFKDLPKNRPSPACGRGDS
ncbi:hypothetical protein [Coxiella burnetii]|uniref:hypothetical protein n=1 Tax=Coxiella burnetii TaxID=777 RepID=UPI00057E4D9E|nr:hypothetical protein [Coxiella burnetii]